MTVNSSPSHHALLATLVVGGVALYCPRWALYFIPVSLVVDVALVTSQSHWPIDVIGSTVFVALGLGAALAGRPHIRRWLGHPAAILQTPLDPDLALMVAGQQEEIDFLSQQIGFLQAQVASTRTRVQEIEGGMPEDRQRAARRRFGDRT